ncbi:MAG: GvpL/GvpF family gas vesicle protein [Candidatus Palauibacterales bacterium]|nr:GvpL/GvpF family gas vesicle protein [Candidatus Palauibacterales bacterium]MDP2530947.1 GvpL/GvpF family gas vesicle protein [Candidatus Palauibacterales bacterium]MDP2583390.1 GvpL/GvpF family gas vesicle protein [Candidatus Palauibacterales bacterium]
MSEARGLAVHAVVRNTRTDRALDALHLRESRLEYELVPRGDLAAAVTAAPFRDATEPDPEALRTHERVVEALLRRSTLVPVPFGLVARDEHAVREFLARRREDLEDALEYLDNSYEMRVHVSLRAGGDGQALQGFLRMLHGSLRGQARAARRLPGKDEGQAAAAFLVGRGEWLRLVEKATRWEGHHPEVELRVTGPWPPYDFVTIEGPGEPDGGADLEATHELDGEQDA